MTKTAHFLFVVPLMLLSTFGWAECKKSDVTGLLETEGHVYTQMDYDDEDHNFSIKKSGETIAMWVTPDGDTSFRKYYTYDGGWPTVDLGQVMRDLKYVAVYFDKDRDVVVSYDIAHFEEGCHPSLVANLSFFFDLVDSVEDRLRELLPAATEEQEPRQPKPTPALISS